MTITFATPDLQNWKLCCRIVGELYSDLNYILPEILLVHQKYTDVKTKRIHIVEPWSMYVQRLS
jgi:hypothetical protein